MLAVWVLVSYHGRWFFTNSSTVIWLIAFVHIQQLNDYFLVILPLKYVVTPLALQGSIRLLFCLRIYSTTSSTFMIREYQIFTFVFAWFGVLHCVWGTCKQRLLFRWIKRENCVTKYPISDPPAMAVACCWETILPPWNTPCIKPWQLSAVCR